MTTQQWARLTKDKQILNVASELSRAASLAKQNAPELVRQSIERALDLADLTIEVTRSKNFLREFLRFRGLLAASYVDLKGAGELRNLIRGLLSLDPVTYNMQLEL